MRSVVMIMAPADDLHARAVQAELGEVSGCTCVIVDTARFPADLRINLIPEDPSASVIESGTHRYRFDQIRSVWLRRPVFAKPSQGLEKPEDRFIAEVDSRHALEGCFGCMRASGCRLVNDPESEFLVRSKVNQLMLARTCGFTIPETRVTNDPAAALDFVRAQGAGQTIYKGFRSPPEVLVSTQVFQPDDEEHLGALRLAPVIFQRFVEGRNIRATVIGDSVFLAEVMVSSEDGERDWRLEVFNEVRASAFSPQCGDAIRAFMRASGLTMGMFDFRWPASGEPVFLEVNPQGQFLFVEIRAGMEICSSVARLLWDG